ncbi:MAG: hypothetical protein ABIA12_01895 [Candidatus Aenigmatarchaeota archaeon]
MVTAKERMEAILGELPQYKTFDKAALTLNLYASFREGIEKELGTIYNTVYGNPVFDGGSIKNVLDALENYNKLVDERLVDAPNVLASDQKLGPDYMELLLIRSEQLAHIKTDVLNYLKYAEGKNSYNLVIYEAAAKKAESDKAAAEKAAKDTDKFLGGFDGLYKALNKIKPSRLKKKTKK